MRNWIEIITEASSDNVFWHGSPSGELRGAHYGLHLGTKEAARQALEAKIGMRADGKDWDGSQEYGKTLLAGSKTQERFYKTGLRKSIKTGYNCGTQDHRLPEEDFYPTDREYRARYSDDTEVPFNVRPELAAYELTGPMTNNRWYPHADWKANGYMKAQNKKGNAKRGYYYRNEGEDVGSISIVVPNGGTHLRKITESIETPDVFYHGTSDLAWQREDEGILYLTMSRDDAANYADEAVVGDFNALDIEYEEGMEMPSKPIVVEFRMSDLTAYESGFEPDWGWADHQPGMPTWLDSLAAVGSFCISGFTSEMKKLGRVEPAFLNENVDAFGTTQRLYHGTNIDNLWLIMKAGKLSANWHGRDYAGPTGVCLSRSFKVASDHAHSWMDNLLYSFFEYFDLGEPPKMKGVVLEFDRSRIHEPIVPYDDDMGGAEEEERVVGDLSLDALVAIHADPKDIEAFLRYAIEAHKKGGNEYDAEFRKVIERVLKDPRLVR